MSDRKRNILDAGERIDYFDAANQQLVTEMPYTVELFAVNKSCITRLHQAGITSASAEGAGLSGTRSKVARSGEIVADLRLVAKTARLMEKKIPGFHNTFTLPRGNLTYDEAIERADSFIADSLANRDGFLKYGLNRQFFVELGADVAAFGDSAQGQADAKRTGVGATADVEAILEELLANRTELDRAIKNHYRNNPQKLAEWLTASHIERKRRVEKPTGENPPTP